jgi:hypothetical protein
LSPVEAASKHGNESSDIHGSLVIAWPLERVLASK